MSFLLIPVSSAIFVIFLSQPLIYGDKNEVSKWLCA